MKKNKKILVIDDDELILLLVKEYLIKDYDVTAFTSPTQALDFMFKSLTPDLIILDLLMPVMDGWETLKKIGTYSFLMFVPIVIISSLGDEKTKKQALELGARDFIKKPFIKEEFLKRIDAVLNTKKQ